MTDLHTRIAELAAKATPGAWSHYTEHEQTGFRMVRTYIQGYDGEHLASRLEPDDAALIVTLRNAIPEILTALREANVLPVWRTIDSAPRDGTWFQVAKINEYCGVARWASYNGGLAEYTHWKPLPTPPEN